MASGGTRRHDQPFSFSSSFLFSRHPKWDELPSEGVYIQQGRKLPSEHTLQDSCSAAHYFSAVTVLYVGAVLLERLNILLIAPLAIGTEKEAVRRALRDPSAKVSGKPGAVLPLDTMTARSDLRRSVANRLAGRKGPSETAVSGATQADNNFESSFAFLGFVTVEVGLLGRVAGDIAITVVGTEVGVYFDHRWLFYCLSSYIRPYSLAGHPGCIFATYPLRCNFCGHDDCCLRPLYGA
jgi:hypothetical protein